MARPPPPVVPPAHKPRVQMADIARLAGVSVSTVSRALAGSPLINAETRERITALARSLNYSIDAGAQALRLKRIHTVAVVVPYDPQTAQHLSDPFFLGLIGGIADALTERGYDMLLTRVDADRLDLAAQPWRSGRAAGVVLIGQWRHHDQLNAMAGEGVPFVVWGAQMPDQRYATVGSHNVEGGRLATAHLLAQGARRIAFLGDTALPEFGQRHQGYLQALQAAGLTPDPSLVPPADLRSDTVERVVTALAAQTPPLDGVFAASDLMAMTAIGTLRRLGRDVPRDVKVVGYDDIALAAHVHPALSTVRQPLDLAGQALVHSLLAQLEGQPPQADLLATQLIVRDSSVVR